MTAASSSSRRARLAFVAAGAAFSVLAPVASAQNYTFTKIADSTKNDLDPFSIGAPSISDAGHVAFSALNAENSISRVFRTGPALAGGLTIIGDSSTKTSIGAFSDNVSVNNVGQVAAWTTISLSNVDERILRGNGGALTTIAQAGDTDQFSFLSVIVSLNDSGTVAWQGELNQPNGPQGLFTGNGGPVNVVFSTATSNFTSSFAGPAINNAGQIGFLAATTTSDGDAIFRYDGGTTFTTIVDTTSPFSAGLDDEPSINNSGRVAVIGRNGDFSTTSLIVGDGTAAPVAVVDTDGELSSIFAASLNDSNQFAYSGQLDDFSTTGIFTGPDVVGDRVIQTGDVLDGSTVTFVSLYREGLNNSGQIAFFAQLEDGRGVVVVASPVPEPTMIGAIAIGAMGLIARRRRSVR